VRALSSTRWAPFYFLGFSRGLRPGLLSAAPPGLELGGFGRHLSLGFAFLGKCEKQVPPLRSLSLRVGRDDRVLGWDWLKTRGSLNQAWNSLASGKRSLHLARLRAKSSSILVSSQLRDMASSLTSK
jgi:hypothetical protein